MENKQVLDITEEELQEMIESGELVLGDTGGETELEDNEKITFDIDVIASMEEISQPVEVEFDKGVFDASQYVGQFATLINSGIDSDTAIVIMSWIREDKLNKDNINMQLEMAKIENIKMKKEML